MLHNSTQESFDNALRPSIMRVVGQRDACVLVAQTKGQEPVAARVSARFDRRAIERFVAAQCQALVMTTQCGTVVVVDFLGDTQAESHILHCDALHIGEQARLWAKGNTLYIRGRNIDIRAEQEQRLRGATVNIG